MNAARLRVPALDAALAVCLLAVAESEVWLGWHDGGVGVPGASKPAEALVFAIPALALARRRSRSTAAAIAIGAVIVLQVAVIARYVPFLPLLLPLALVNYSNAAYGRPRLRIVGLLAVAAGTAAVNVLVPQGRQSGEILFSAFVVAGTWLVGDLVRQRQRRVELVEASREQWARAAVAEERERIARELHDVVAHSVSLMGVQAGAARLLLADEPAKASAVLTSVEATARDSVAELQRLLSILRAPASAENGPQPGLADLGKLIEATRAAGLHVEFDPEALPGEVVPGQGLTVYRIVQEALTNVRKHAHASRVYVSVRSEGENLEIEIRDDGRSPGGPRRRGHGLIGMRERALLYGGTLEAGHAPDGGFVVRARLPLGVREQ